MAVRKDEHSGGFLARWDDPLIGVPEEIDGERFVRYFTSEEDADAARGKDSKQAALDAIGAWSDLDLDEMLDELDRIRHDSTPTPPIDLDQ